MPCNGEESLFHQLPSSRMTQTNTTRRVMELWARDDLIRIRNRQFFPNQNETGDLTGLFLVEEE